MEWKTNILELIIRAGLTFIFLTSLSWDNGNNNLMMWINEHTMSWGWINIVAQNTLYLAIGIGVISLFVFRQNRLSKLISK